MLRSRRAQPRRCRRQTSWRHTDLTKRTACGLVQAGLEAEVPPGLVTNAFRRRRAGRAPCPQRHGSAAWGSILGMIGLLRILLWPTRATLYGEHYILVAITVACSLVGVVLWGTISGSMLPLIMRRLGFDPASASAPFVATLVDVTGLIIYFTVASVILYGALL